MTKAFLAARRGVLVLPEADQQVRRQADALPAQEEAHEVGREHEHQHRGDEEVEVAEEPAPPRVVLHVAHRVQVDERPDTGDQQQEERGQRVVEQVHADVHVAGLEPGPQVLAHLPVALIAAQQREEQHQAEQEGDGGGEESEPVAPAIHRATGERPADEEHQRPERRQRDHQPQQREHAVGGRGADDRHAAVRFALEEDVGHVRPL